MTRNEEYKALLQELEATPELLKTTVERAVKRENASRKKRRFSGVSLGSLAACFTAFVLLVNLMPTFAYACGGVPLLRELAKAVAWSPSLSAAVENEYVQPIGLTQTKNGITATIEYLIVDQKQVNIFYTLEGEYEDLSGREVAFSPDQHCSVSYGGAPNAPDTLQDITMDYVDEDVPEGFSVTIGVASMDEELHAPPAAYSVEDEMLNPSEEREELEILAEFTFDLKFDPYYTAQGEIIPVNQTITLDGQRVTVTEAEVYPTHVRVNVADDPDNTAWLKGLSFYLENEDGERFEPISNGITATGSDTPTMVSYRLESAYFARSRHLTLHITGAEWLDKDRERIEIDLANRRADDLPEGVSLKSAEQYDSGWILQFRVKKRKDDHTHQVFYTTFEDESGSEYDMRSQSHFTDYEGGDYIYSIEQLPLPDYHGGTVWLRPTYTRTTAEQTPVTIPIK